MTETTEDITRTELEIAVIGMAGRFPGAKDIDEFWENLKNGIESVSFFSEEELAAVGIPPQLLEQPNFVKAKGILEDIEFFDSTFFEYSPREADIMNPQMRIFHECSWQALEDSGYDPASYSGLIGLYAGATQDIQWLAANLAQGGSESEGFLKVYLNSNYFSTLVSYKLNLRGPGVTVQTACSTSLAAIHMACRALLTGECDIALAGGVTVTLPKISGYLYQEGMILSPDGHCRAFAAGAAGTIAGDGVGVVVLKRLVDAVTYRDNIYAVVKGTIINNDGNRKTAYTAPSEEGQVDVIRAAHQLAEVKPESIGYIEAHGTGTNLGDPIEIEALKQAFNTEKKGFCGIGSVKTNVGHLDSAAGAAGFIKTVLALKYRLIPPSLHFDHPNPEIDFENSPFYVVTRLQEWKNQKYPLRAAVSSFGIGGTNVHVILEEFPGGTRGLAPLSNRLHQLILLSAKTQSALDRMTENLAGYFRKKLLNPGNPGNPTNPGQTLADAAYTLQVGRKAFKYRHTVVVSTLNEAIDALSNSSAQVPAFFTRRENRAVIFMFPGQGAQYMNMGRELYRQEPVFRDEMNRCFEILKPLLKFDIKEIIYRSDQSDQSDRSDRSDILIDQTEIAQPVLFVIEYALAKLLMKWGITPAAMIGHSIGEYSAACLSGVFSLEDALKLVVLRGKLMQQLPPGAMLGVPLPEKELAPLLKSNEELSLAAVNSPGNCVVSGTPGATASFAQQLSEQGYESRPLHTSHAFHSQMMEPILEEFAGNVGKVVLNKPGIPYIANVTGKFISADQAIDPGYWARHLRSTVRFSPGIEELLTADNPVFVEVGPGKVLCTLVRQHGDKEAGKLSINLIRHPKENLSDRGYLLKQIGRLWSYGVKIDWQEFYRHEKRNRISLPTYPFERLPYRIHIESRPVNIEISPGQETQANYFQDTAKPETVPLHRRTLVETEYVAPGSQLEQLLVAIWQKMFGIREIGINDDFFELGGDSLKAMTLGTEIHKETDVRIPVDQLFEKPTISELAKYIMEAGPEKYAALEAVEKKEYYALSSVQKRLFIIQQLEGIGIAYNLPETIIIEGETTRQHIEETVKLLIKKHESLRTSFKVIEDQPAQIIHEPDQVDFALEYYRREDLELQPADGKQEEERIVRYLVKPFALNQAPLLRAVLVELSAGKHLLLFDMHHIISDGTSIVNFANDFMALYEGRELPGLPIQYKDFARWQNSKKGQAAIEKQEEYWLNRFKGEIPVLNLFTDYPRPTVQSFAGERVNFIFEKELTQQMKKLAADTGTTLYMLLLAVYNILLARYSGDEDIIVGSPTAGREYGNLENVIGLFINALPMRNFPKAEKTFTRFLKEVKTNTLQAYNNQGYPFGDLIEKLGIANDLSRNPLFDVELIVQNMELQDWQIDGLKITPYDFDARVTQVDLALYVYEFAGGISFVLWYCTALFKRETIRRSIAFFKDIVSTVVQNPGIKLGDIKISHQLVDIGSGDYKEMAGAGDFEF